MKPSRNGDGERPKAHHSATKLQPVAPSLRAAAPKKRLAKELPVLITGGAGFIGTNLANHYLTRGQRVVLFDNLSRPGVEANFAWLRATHGELVEIRVADVQDFELLRRAVRGVGKVFHFAAQVAATTSLSSPFHDFDVNARGTLNLLEALRELRAPPPLLFASTNKVYGSLNDVPLQERGGRYEPEDPTLGRRGFDESRRLDFYSPFGCSKGAAEQYVLDYARTFGLRAAVFRMSCVYGPHQFGTEDQGWVAHFLIRALHGAPITVYGDGKQVRDLLFVDDLVEALVGAQDHINQITGQVFNIGGGPANTISLLELIELIADLQKARPLVRFDDWRPADQRYYVSDTARFTKQTGWRPEVVVRAGVERLWHWLSEVNRAPRFPVVLSAPSIAAADGERGGDGQTAGPKLVTDREGITDGEPRSKRMWKLESSGGPGMGAKIIKFP